MPSKKMIPIAVAVAVLAAPTSAHAQGAGAAPSARPAAAASNWSVQGSLLFSSFSIDDDEGSESGGGAGFDVQGRWHRDRLSIGFGLQGTTHEVEAPGDNEDLTHSVLYVEPRLSFPQLFAASNPKLMPYASARLGRSGYKTEMNDRDIEAQGWLFGVGAGVLYEMSPSTALDVGLGWSHVGFGDAEVDGDKADDSDFGSNQVALRVGVSYRFGMGARR